MKIRRTLDPATAHGMVAVREARPAYRAFYASSFWSYRKDLKITQADVPWVAEQLSTAIARRGGAGERPILLASRDAGQLKAVFQTKPPSMNQTLFTLGYQQRSIREFVSLLVDAGIDVLVDVRETAWSHKPGFSKGALERALDGHGIEYVHAAFAGNPKWLRANAESHRECLDWYSWYLQEFDEIVPAFDALIAGYLRDGKRVCITCFERHADDCHRAILASDWQKRGRRAVQHLAIEGCDRLLTA
jgi:hypothetical protein